MPMDLAHRLILLLPTFLPIIHTTDNFDVALVQLMERWDWAIAAYRSYLSLPMNNSFMVIFTLVFLAIAQGMRLLYSQLTAEQLRTLIDLVGPHTFAIVAAIPSCGVVIIPIMQILCISGSSITTASLMLAVTVPVVILPLMMLCFPKARSQRFDDGQA
ncbi:hypothetical protein EDC04DRAFT_2734345 [Pisolithus marmoratus]|nr:hypothetical protein EDC04DRAFT_2734345 [Pisolithus marmoratus]